MDLFTFDCTSFVSSSEHSSSCSSAMSLEQENLKKYYESFQLHKNEIEATTDTWVQENIKESSCTTIVEPSHCDEVPLTVYNFSSDSKSQDKDHFYVQKRRGRKRKDWESIEKSLYYVKSNPEVHRKLRNNISSAQYRIRRSIHMVETEEKHEEYRKINHKLVRHLSILEEFCSKFRLIKDSCFDFNQLQTYSNVFLE